MRIIGLTGLKRCGKNTVGTYLSEKHGYTELSFAAKLKEVAQMYLNCVTLTESDRETDQTFTVAHRNIIKAAMKLGIENDSLYEFQQKFLDVFDEFSVRGDESHTTYKTTYRKVLQLFGTDVCRHFVDDIWVGVIKDRIVNNPDDKFVITDVRFDNEARMVHDAGGTMIEITRSSCVRDNHLSERGVSNWYIDEIITNDDEITGLLEQVDVVLEEKWKTSSC